MRRRDIRIRASEGGEFDGYLVQPEGDAQVPAIVLASAIYGVDADIRRIADELASRNDCIAAAPDLFWRTRPGPLPHGDPTAPPRGQPRLEKIKTGEADLIDVLAALREQPGFNGRAAVMGFCFGGPYAILGPRRLGYEAGISCHGTQMLDFIPDLEGVEKPICLIWGDQDHAAPAEVLEAYRRAARRMSNVEVHVFPGLLHGFMMKANTKAFDAKAHEFALDRAQHILDGLR
jgi:carboxymethylenebutenolidase